VPVVNGGFTDLFIDGAFKHRYEDGGTSPRYGRFFTVPVESRYRLEVHGVTGNEQVQYRWEIPFDPRWEVSVTPADAVSRGARVVFSAYLGFNFFETTAVSLVGYQWFDGNAQLVDGPLSSGSIATGTTGGLQIDNVQLADELLRPRIVATFRCHGFDGDFFITTESGPFEIRVCAGDFNLDGGTDGSDVSSFFAAWEQGGAFADVNGDGGVDGADVGVFFEHWEQGC
jgi:hypothetical protein